VRCLDCCSGGCHPRFEPGSAGLGPSRAAASGNPHETAPPRPRSRRALVRTSGVHAHALLLTDACIYLRTGLATCRTVQYARCGMAQTVSTRWAVDPEAAANSSDVHAQLSRGQSGSAVRPPHWVDTSPRSARRRAAQCVDCCVPRSPTAGRPTAPHPPHPQWRAREMSCRRRLRDSCQTRSEDTRTRLAGAAEWRPRRPRGGGMHGSHARHQSLLPCAGASLVA
jgi:hypothetical protein